MPSRENSKLPVFATQLPPLVTSRFWNDPDDPDAVRVWADALVEQGDVRGEFIQLSTLDQPTAKQVARREALRKKLGGQLVGPARPFLRSWRLGRFGLVSSIVTEAKLFVPGFELIAQLHPRLTATVTALRTKPLIEQFSKLALARIHYLIVDWTGLTDSSLTLIAPAFEGVKNLSLAFNDFTRAGLEALAPHATSLESLALGSLKQREQGDSIGSGWVDALTSHEGFANLRSVTLCDYHSPLSEPLLRRLRAMPKMKYVGVDSPLYLLETLEAAKSGAMAGP
jgi:hypothetical protein